MADKASILAAWNAVLAEAQLLPGVVTPPPPPPPPPPPGTGVLANLAPNTARNHGSYVNPHPDWFQKGANITDDSGSAADPAREQFLLMGGSHGRSQETDIRAFNTRTGVWSSLYPSTLWQDMTAANCDSILGRWINTNQPVARHTYSCMVVRGDYLHVLAAYCNPDNLPIGPGQTAPGQLASFTGRLCKYHFPTKVWTYSAHGPQWFHASGACLDPQSQKIYVVGLGPNASPGRVWMYEPDIDKLTAGPFIGNGTIGHLSQPTDFNYCPDDDKFYAFNNGGLVWRITIDRANLNNCAWTRLTTTGPKPVNNRPTGYPAFSWDTVNKLFGGCFVNGVHYQFNPATLAFTATTMLVEAGSTGAPSNDFSCSKFMDDYSKCYAFVQYQSSANVPKTWGYRP